MKIPDYKDHVLTETEMLEDLTNTLQEFNDVVGKLKTIIEKRSVYLKNELTS